MKVQASFCKDTKAVPAIKTVHSVDVDGSLDLVTKLTDAGHSDADITKWLYNGYAISHINSGARGLDTQEEANAFIVTETKKLGGTVQAGVPKGAGTMSAEDKAKAKMLADAGISAEQLAELIAMAKK